MRHWGAVVLVLLAFSGPASAGGAASVRSKTVANAKSWARDARDLTLAPAHWNRDAWERAAAGAAAVGALYVWDASLVRQVQERRSGSTDHFAKVITPFGGRRVLNISAVMILCGALSGRTNLRDAGIDSLESEVWAAGVVTPLIKRLAGRARPIQEEGSHSFHPFKGKYESFPSGHTTNAFAFATAVAGHYDGWIVPTIVYSLATGVAASRVNDRAHFPSDVVAGALIGRMVARGILARHRSAHTVSASVLPLIERGQRGLSVRLRFR